MRAQCSGANIAYHRALQKFCATPPRGPHIHMGVRGERHQNLRKIAHGGGDIGVGVKRDSDWQVRACDVSQQAQYLPLAIFGKVGDHRAVKHQKDPVPSAFGRLCNQRVGQYAKRIACHNTARTSGGAQHMGYVPVIIAPGVEQAGKFGIALTAYCYRLFAKQQVAIPEALKRRRINIESIGFMYDFSAENIEAQILNPCFYDWPASRSVAPCVDRAVFDHPGSYILL